MRNFCRTSDYINSVIGYTSNTTMSPGLLIAAVLSILFHAGRLHAGTGSGPEQSWYQAALLRQPVFLATGCLGILMAFLVAWIRIRLEKAGGVAATFLGYFFLFFMPYPLGYLLPTIWMDTKDVSAAAPSIIICLFTFGWGFMQPLIAPVGKPEFWSALPFRLALCSVGFILFGIEWYFFPSLTGSATQLDGYLMIIPTAAACLAALCAHEVLYKEDPVWSPLNGYLRKYPLLGLWSDQDRKHPSSGSSSASVLELFFLLLLYPLVLCVRLLRLPYNMMDWFFRLLHLLPSDESHDEQD